MAITKTKKMPIDVRNHSGYEITYLVDDLQVKALLLLPYQRVKRIVVYLRGGKGQVGKVRTGRLLQFANAETLVVGPYYRGNNGSEGKDDFYGEDLKDVTTLVKLLHTQYPDAAIHMIGFSRGGLQGLLTYYDLPVSSFIIWGGVSDIKLMYEERVDLRGMLRRMIGHPKKQAAAYQLRDAMQYITPTSPPILIVHGAQDHQVGIHQAYYLAQALNDISLTYRTVYQQQEGHVPRPFALSPVLNQIQQWMSDVEHQTIQDDYAIE
ncbi:MULTISPECIES: alpha/beta hydrolase family protein [Staphylococcus]|uniref:Peptidase n=2 Tax=Staphylococcus TaxID=1279 RepID=A0A380CBI3_9STAP|nr:MULTISPECIES: prolyl oligopeptidase family serine peptidase [Staphylococcus]EJY95717.1 peptidase [Staphylococcus arlettae CVD059]MCD8833697.1 prolyl oligopeptidase family serine peptidase [Staphylococcus arlettae]MCD8889298.1 prolyl oligopeptidase family serine peptidase [Staphylococcus arlettae]MCD9054970.1 prolyl oligopeptidase family serine peptidase [Staphylococcus arlettae]MCP8713610.1 prolyl oligopeptidase family serine peptidase [Staphylococcus arlettae]